MCLCRGSEGVYIRVCMGESASGRPVSEHQVNPGGPHMTYQSKHAQITGLGPPCPSSKKPGLWGWVGEGKGLPDFPNTVAPGLGDHPLDSSRLELRVCWGRNEGPTSQHLEPGALLGRWAEGNLYHHLKEAHSCVGTRSPGDCLSLEEAAGKGVASCLLMTGLLSLAPEGEAGALL